MSKKLLLFLVFTIIGVLLYWWWGGPTVERMVSIDTIENESYSFEFQYLNGEDGYEVIASNTTDSFLQSYVLVQKDALHEYQTTASDIAPPTISVFVFKLPDAVETEGEQSGRITRLQNWAQENAGISAFDAIYGTPDIVEIDGVRALEYTTDGVYQQSIFLASYRGNIYMFVGQYDRPTDFIKQDFENLMRTVKFE